MVLDAQKEPSREPVGAAPHLLQRWLGRWPRKQRIRVGILALAGLTLVGSSLHADLDYARFTLAPAIVFLSGLVLPPGAALLAQALHLMGFALALALSPEGLLRPELVQALAYCPTAWLISRYRSLPVLPAFGRGIVLVGGLGFSLMAGWLMRLYPHLAMVLFAAVIVALMVYFGKSALRYRFWLMTAGVFTLHLVSLPLLFALDSLRGALDLQRLLLFGIAIHVPGHLLMGLIASRMAFDLRRIIGELPQDEPEVESPEGIHIGSLQKASVFSPLTPRARRKKTQQTQNLS